MATNDGYSFNSNDLLFRIFSYKKHLLIISALAFVVSSIVVLFFLPPLYKSTVVLFPAPSSSISQSFVSSNNAFKSESVFGTEEELEQLLQVLHSDDLRNRIIEKHDLWNHYNIDISKEKYPLNKMLKRFNKRIQFGKTRYMAAEISVYDTHPQKASDIANDIKFILDSVMNAMVRARAIEAFTIVREEYYEKQQQINRLEDSLARIMQKGVFDFESQSEVLNKAYADALASGNTAGAQRVKDKLDVLAQYGSAYISLRDFLLYEKEQLSMFNARYKEAKINAEREITNFFVVNSAFPSDKKAKPLRSVIVLISVIGTFLFAFVVLVFIDLLREFSARESSLLQEK